MKVSAFSAGCGAVVEDIQLAGLTDVQIVDLRSIFAEYGVVFFRDQELSPSEHHRFATRFGDIHINPFFKPVDGFTDIAEVRKEKGQKTNIGGGWHTDHSYDDKPAMGSILVARDLPAKGGDTRFANLAKAYDTLSDGLKSTLESLRAIHSNVHIYGKDGLYAGTDIAYTLSGSDKVGNAVHPVVIKHPESGRKVLYVNPAHTISFEGWSYEESRPLLDYLYAHVDKPETTCSFNWQPGSIAFWDNRSTWHFANNDYHGEARLMHRITLSGSVLDGI
ncbi:MAG: taurine dioxygenase [Pseudomonadales bacterium]|jgi:taurine dioxygenase